MVKQIVGTDEKGNNLSYNETLHKLIEREKINLEERNILVSHQSIFRQESVPKI